MKANLLIALLLMVHTLCHAGEIGNGGHVVICETPTGTTYEVLDFYEARKLGISLDLGEPDWDYQRKVRHAIRKLDRLDVDRAEDFRTQAENFLSLSVMLSEVPDTRDEGETNIESHCNIVQAAAQFKPQFPGDRRYLIKQSLWKKLDSTQKAGLVLHEIVYGDAIKRFHFETSETSRSFTVLLASEKMKRISPQEYVDLMQKEFHVGIFQPVLTNRMENGSPFVKDDAAFYWGRSTYPERHLEIYRFDPVEDLFPKLVLTMNKRSATLLGVHQGYFFWSQPIRVSVEGQYYWILNITSPTGKTSEIHRTQPGETLDRDTLRTVGDTLYFMTELRNGPETVRKVSFVNPGEVVQVYRADSIHQLEVDSDNLFLNVSDYREHSLVKISRQSGEVKTIQEFKRFFGFVLYQGDIFFTTIGEDAIFKLPAGAKKPKVFWKGRVAGFKVIGDYVYWFLYTSDHRGAITRKALNSDSPAQVITILPWNTHASMEVLGNYLYTGPSARMRKHNLDWFDVCSF